MKRVRDLAIVTCLGHYFEGSLASTPAHNDRTKKVLEWLSQGEGFYLNEKLMLKDGTILAVEIVEEDELLMAILMRVMT